MEHARVSQQEAVINDNPPARPLSNEIKNLEATGWQQQTKRRGEREREYNIIYYMISIERERTTGRVYGRGNDPVNPFRPVAAVVFTHYGIGSGSRRGLSTRN